MSRSAWRSAWANIPAASITSASLRNCSVHRAWTPPACAASPSRNPACGSGGMFVQSEKFVEEHGGRVGDIAVYGQESNYTTRKLARMNLAFRGIDANLQREFA